MRRGDLPGAVIEAGTRAGVIFRRAYGFQSLEPTERPMQPDAIFDLASVTKAAATATSVAALVESGKLSYDAPASRYLRALDLPDKRAITLRQLLTHTSGLPADNVIASDEHGLASAVRAIASLHLAAPPGTRYVYSDLGFILLGAIVERAAGEPLDAFATEHLFKPLELSSTGFRPAPDKRLVPTERRGDHFLLGVVQDPRSRALGGVAGHAGLFSSADDLGRFARMLLHRGELDGVRVLAPTTVARMTAPIAVPGARVALGWDVPDDPSTAAFSPDSFGHEGYTGTSLWIDPRRGLFVVFLSSRLHPDGKGRVVPLARAIRRVIAGASHNLQPAESIAKPGIDTLEQNGAGPLAGKRIALLTNDAARDSDGKRTTDALFAMPGVQLVRLLAPEHGIAVDGSGKEQDALTRTPVVNVYRRAPALGDVDMAVVDLPDVGVRFYTYAASMLRLMRAAARAGKPVVVLDRPDPIGGRVAGPPADPGPSSLIRPFPTPIQHGMTLGELARLFAGELDIGVKLAVVEATGWRRTERFAQTGLMWFAPSPNLPTPDAALLYPGVALFETTNLSVGRGTAKPFELLGAPWLDAQRLVQQLGRPPGVLAQLAAFVPRAAPYAGQLCHGVLFSVVDPARARPIALALRIAEALRSVPDWDRSGFALLLDSRRAHDATLAGDPVPRIVAAWQPALDAFKRVRSRYLLYP